MTESHSGKEFAARKAAYANEIDDWYRLLGELLGEIRGRVAVCLDRLSAGDLDGTSRQLWLNQLTTCYDLLLALREGASSTTRKTELP